MKKWISFMMIAVLCMAALTACGSSNSQQSDVNVQNQASDEAAEQSPQAEEQENAAEPETEEQENLDDADIQEDAENEEDEQQEASDGQAGKVLVVYYSASGNTKKVGDVIAQYTNADTFEIIPVNEYTDEDLDWQQKGSRVNLEHEDESLQDIELVSTTVDNFESYDTVFIGYAGGIIGLNQEKPINQGFALV